MAITPANSIQQGSLGKASSAPPSPPLCPAPPLPPPGLAWVLAKSSLSCGIAGVRTTCAVAWQPTASSGFWAETAAGAGRHAAAAGRRGRDAATRRGANQAPSLLAQPLPHLCKERQHLCRVLPQALEPKAKGFGPRAALNAGPQFFELVIQSLARVLL